MFVALFLSEINGYGHGLDRGASTDGLKRINRSES